MASNMVNKVTNAVTKPIDKTIHMMVDINKPFTEIVEQEIASSVDKNGITLNNSQKKELINSIQKKLSQFRDIKQYNGDINVKTGKGQ